MVAVALPLGIPAMVLSLNGSEAGEGVEPSDVYASLSGYPWLGTEESNLDKRCQKPLPEPLG